MGFFKTKKEKQKNLLKKLQKERAKTSITRDISTIKEEISKSRKERFDLKTKGIRKFAKGVGKTVATASEGLAKQFEGAKLDFGFDEVYETRPSKKNKSKKKVDVLGGGFDFGF